MWNFVGNSYAVSLLDRAIREGSPAHAYLLAGPSHVGKKTLAIRFAQALNCAFKPPPCRVCPSCQRIAEGKHADVSIIGVEPGSSRTEIGIDQIRALSHQANFPPYEGRYRVFIMDRAELLSLEAANCLLKTLEEPPGRVVFMLLVAHVDSIPATVVSRCEGLNLRPVAKSEIEEALRTQFGLEPERSRLISRRACGLPGRAFALAQDESLLAAFDAYRQELLRLFVMDDANRLLYSGELTKRFSSNREEVLDMLGVWLTLAHDMLREGVGQGGLVSNVDIVSEVRRYAQGTGCLEIRRLIDHIQSAITDLRRNANTMLAFDSLALSVPYLREVNVGQPQR